MTLPDSVRAQLAYRDYAVNNKCTCMRAQHTYRPMLFYILFQIFCLLDYGSCCSLAQKRKKEHASQYASELPKSQHISYHEGTPGKRAFLKAEHGTTQNDSTLKRKNTSRFYRRQFQRFHRAFKECSRRRGSGGYFNCSASVTVTWLGRIVLEHRLLPWFARQIHGRVGRIFPKALLPSCRAEIPSNPHSQLLQGRLTLWDKGLQWGRRGEEGKGEERRGIKKREERRGNERKRKERTEEEEKTGNKRIREEKKRRWDETKQEEVIREQMRGEERKQKGRRKERKDERKRHKEKRGKEEKSGEKRREGRREGRRKIKKETCICIYTNIIKKSLFIMKVYFIVSLLLFHPLRQIHTTIDFYTMSLDWDKTIQIKILKKRTRRDKATVAPKCEW